MATPRFTIGASALALAGCCVLLVGCGETSKKSGLATQPDLNHLEEFQMADLQRHLGSTFQFHRDGCVADVTLDDVGNVLVFTPNDPELCKRVLSTCGYSSPDYP